MRAPTGNTPAGTAALDNALTTGEARLSNSYSNVVTILASVGGGQGAPDDHVVERGADPVEPRHSDDHRHGLGDQSVHAQWRRRKPSRPRGTCRSSSTSIPDVGGKLAHAARHTSLPARAVAQRIFFKRAPKAPARPPGRSAAATRPSSSTHSRAARCAAAGTARRSRLAGQVAASQRRKPVVAGGRVARAALGEEVVERVRERLASWP
ncbi:hypothetical protein OKW45_006675 [Paraburkholderia sp. WSM4175]